MKHAGADALDALEHPLGEIRGVSGLVEKNRGVFSRNSKAFLQLIREVVG